MQILLGESQHFLNLKAQAPLSLKNSPLNTYQLFLRERFWESRITSLKKNRKKEEREREACTGYQLDISAAYNTTRSFLKFDLIRKSLKTAAENSWHKHILPDFLVVYFHQKKKKIRWGFLSKILKGKIFLIVTSSKVVGNLSLSLSTFFLFSSLIFQIYPIVFLIFLRAGCGECWT